MLERRSPWHLRFLSPYTPQQQTHREGAAMVDLNLGGGAASADLIKDVSEDSFMTDVVEQDAGSYA